MDIKYERDRVMTLLPQTIEQIRHLSRNRTWYTLQANRGTWYTNYLLNRHFVRTLESGISILDCWNIAVPISTALLLSSAAFWQNVEEEYGKSKTGCNCCKMPTAQAICTLNQKIHSKFSIYKYHETN